MSEEQEQQEKEQEAPPKEETVEVKRDAPPPPKGSTKPISLGRDVQIFPGDPIQPLPNNYVQTYRARIKSKNADAIAILCDRAYTPRISRMSQYATLDNPNIMHIRASGIVNWPGDGREYFALVYEDNLGAPLVENDMNCALGLKQDLVYEKVLIPLLTAVKEMHNVAVTHGSIRPANIFRGSGQTITDVILGECMSTPVGLTQSVLYETIERGLCQPTGKGKGHPSDDLYSLGVTIACLVRKNNNLKGLTDKEIIKRKIEQGTFAALVARERIAGPVLEFLRGVLLDDFSERWTMGDVSEWLSGKRIAPKSSGRTDKANRPIVFNNEKYLYPAALATDIADNPSISDEIVNNNDIFQWTERSMENKIYKKGVENAVKATKRSVSSKSMQFHNILGMRLAVGLHPNSPVRYKGLSVMPDGFDAALTEAYLQKKDVDSYRELIMNDDFMFWAANNAQYNYLDTNALTKQFETCHGFVQTSAPGYGLERCIYFLNEDMPCISPIVKNFYVRTPEDLVHVLDKICKSKNAPDKMFDRHVLAFLLSKERNLLENQLIDLNSAHQGSRFKAMLKIFSTLQRQSNLPPLNGIAKWFYNHRRPILERFHDREYRKELEEKMKKASGSGDLIKLHELVDNPEAVEHDFLSYKNAMKEFREIDSEYYRLQNAQNRPEKIGNTRSAELATLACLVMAIIIILGFAATVLGSYQNLGF